jgi:hypothetical protein
MSERNIRDWLSREAPPLDEWFAEASSLIDAGPSRVRARIICHCVREIGNRLPDKLLGGQSTRVEYPRLLDELAPVWNSGTSDGEDGNSISISREAYDAVNSVLKAHETRGAHIDRYILMFQRLDPSGKTNLEEVAKTAKEYHSLLKWFVVHAHQPNKSEDDFDGMELPKKWSAFVGLIGILSTGFFDLDMELANVLGQANRRTD